MPPCVGEGHLSGGDGVLGEGGHAALFGGVEPVGGAPGVGGDAVRCAGDEAGDGGGEFAPFVLGGEVGDAGYARGAGYETLPGLADADA